MDDDDDVFKTSPRNQQRHTHDDENNEEDTYRKELSHKFDLDTFSRSVDTGSSSAKDNNDSAKFGITRQYTEPEKYCGRIEKLKAVGEIKGKDTEQTSMGECFFFSLKLSFWLTVIKQTLFRNERKNVMLTLLVVGKISYS